jgi:D-3-phosphoglycerate dehydrogenase / 2-oxoglutarate reductase
MKKVAIIKDIHSSGIDILEKNPNFEYEIIENFSKDNLVKKLPDFDAISIKTAKLDSEIINKCKKLKIISRHGVGYDNIDLNSVKSNKITLTITATANAVAVSEHVMFMILNLSKGFGLYDKTVKDGNFLNRSKLKKSFELWNKKILIVGFGRVGKTIINNCLGFGMKVYIYDPFVDTKIIKSFNGIKVDNFSAALKEADYVSIHVPLNEKTKNLINLKNLKTMKKSSIIINTSRGGIVNETDLNEALNKGFIYGAGLDVFEKEPPDNNNALLKNEKIILSPHTATFTEECTARMGVETIENIINFFENKLNKEMIVKL